MHGRLVVAWVVASLIALGCTASSSRSSASMATPTASSATSPTEQPSRTTQPSPSPRAYESGEPLASIESPSASTCDSLLRADLAAARGIRAGLDYFELASDEATVAAAAADPAADLTQLGIPLLARDIAALQSAGLFIDGRTPMISWVSMGRQDLFGGAWIDPPEDQSSVVVSIVDADPAAHTLARCLERPGVRTRYVFAERSQADLHAIQAAIEADRDTLPAEGIRLISTTQLPNENIVEVGVEGITDEIATELGERYGEGIRVVEDRPSVPD